MSFFSIENPFFLILSLVLLMALLRGLLGRMKYFSGSKSVLILPILIVVAIIALVYRPILTIFGSFAGLATGLLIFIIFVWIMLATMGMKPSKAFTAVREVGFLKLTVIITVACIFVFSISQVYGEKLLNEPSVSFTEGFVEEPEKADLDLSPIFSAKFLGMALVIIVLLMFAFYVVLQ